MNAIVSSIVSDNSPLMPTNDKGRNKVRPMQPDPNIFPFQTPPGIIPSPTGPTPKTTQSPVPTFPSVGSISIPGPSYRKIVNPERQYFPRTWIWEEVNMRFV